MMSDMRDGKVFQTVHGDTVHIQPQPQALTIAGFATLHPDGTLTPSDGYTPDAAAQAFWDAMQAYNPLRGEVDRLRDVEPYNAALKSEIANLTDLQDATLFAAAASVKELQAQIEALRQVARAVADYDDDKWYDGGYKCHWCSLSYMMTPDDAQHDADCPVTMARALLAADGTPTS